MSSLQQFPAHSTVTVRAPARLHLGFIDITGSAGRQFGSVGICINEIATKLSASLAGQHHAQGPGHARAMRCIERITSHFGTDSGIAVTIHQAIPEHIGLGSGTQMELAVAAACSRLLGYTLDADGLTSILGRGARSGIGLACFEQGGLIVDGGKGHHDGRPPVISRLCLPQDWRFLLILDHRGQGLHGKKEKDAFASLPPFLPSEAHRLAHLILMQALPAVAEGDIRLFGEAVTELQRTVGDYFAPAQGGCFTSPAVAEALAWLKSKGATGIGQSSWGPTGFCMAASPSQAETWSDMLREKYFGSGHLEIMTVTPRNRGADIHHSACKD